jgi:hypothetical protein
VVDQAGKANPSKVPEILIRVGFTEKDNDQQDPATQRKKQDEKNDS